MNPHVFGQESWEEWHVRNHQGLAIHTGKACHTHDNHQRSEIVCLWNCAAAHLLNADFLTTSSARSVIFLLRHASRTTRGCTGRSILYGALIPASEFTWFKGPLVHYSLHVQLRNLQLGFSKMICFWKLASLSTPHMAQECLLLGRGLRVS